ncbi:unnamed protein product [Blepharisma stoltei]|uniref:Uncharacterized protein n=1 Tax=Blepharisma stoltei TaxID=1481888 RepID=A0AAU9JGT8_9CILI|nr:unnamed protein product [Blepharisma stoltei]
MEDPIINHNQLTTVPTFEQNLSNTINSEAHPCPTEHNHKFSKNSAKYVIESKKNSPRIFENRNIKSHKGNAVVPYINSENKNLIEKPDEEHKLVYAETFRERSSDKLETIITHSKTTRNHHEEARPRTVRISKCGKCKKLSYIENDICCHCKTVCNKSSYLKSFARASAYCCCWLCT